jgi:uncharacterized repeat protein (TIGR03943 family)
VKRDVQALVLVLLGGAVLRISLDGTYLRYVKPGLLPVLVIAGAIVLILGLLSAWYDGLLRGEPAGAGDGHEHVHDDGHGHGHGGPRVAWLLLLPVLGIFLVAPPALGAYSADRSTFVGQPMVDLEPLPDGDVIDLPVRDYVTRAVWDAGRSLDGRTVRLTGFAAPRGDGGEWDLARLALSCCAADALASKVRPVGDVPVLDPEQWVEVTGRWVEGGGLEDPRAVPRIEVTDVVPIEAPEETYE